MASIVCIVGRKNTGKTALLEKLIAQLKQQGYKVATIKHTADDFELDQPGKDSWRHAQAGSDAVAISSPQKLAVIKRIDHDSTLDEITQVIGGDFDIILTEGFTQSKAPKIEVHRRELGEKLICSPRELLAVVTDEALDISAPQYAPDNMPGLVDLIEERFLSHRKDEEIALFINRVKIPLNPFIRRFIINTLVGMVSTLKGIGAIKSLNISIRRKTQT